MLEKYKLGSQKFMEAWTACSIMMVQGNLSVFTVKHAITAAKTGVIAALLVVLTSYVIQLNNRYIMAWMTGVLTALADMVIHPTHFGPNWMEAACTGLGALMLSGILYKETK